MVTNRFTWLNTLFLRLKACVLYYLYYSKRKHFKNSERCFLFYLKSSLRYRDIQFYLIFFFPFHSFQVLKKKNFSKYFVLQSQERLQTSFRPLLFFIIFSIKRDWLQREKIKLTLYKK